MTLGAFLALALLGGVHVAGGLAVLWLWLRPARRCDWPLVSGLIAATTFYAMPIVACAFLNRISRELVAAFALVPALALGVLAVRGQFGALFAEIGAGLAPDAKASRGGRWCERLLAGGLALLLLVLLFAGARLPIRTWDARDYHALNAMRWHETHRFLLDSYGPPTQDPIYACAEVYPNAKALLPFLVLEWTGKEAGTALAQWPFLLLALAGMFSLVRRAAGGPRWIAWVGVWFVVLAPEVLLQAMESYSDVMLLAGCVGFVAVAVRARAEGLQAGVIVAGALAIGITAGAKAASYPMAALMSLALPLVVLVRRRECIPCSISHMACLVALSLAAALAFTGPWLARGVFHYENPIYPNELILAGQRIFSGPIAAGTSWKQVELMVGTSGVTAWVQAMFEATRLPVIGAWSGGFGAHTVILGVPALVLVLLLGRTASGGRETLLAVALFGVLLVASPLRIVLRYVLFEVALFGLAYCWMLARIPPLARSGWLLMLGLLGAFNLARTVPAVLLETRPPEWVTYALFSGDSRPAMMDRAPDVWSALDAWREVEATEHSVVGVTPGIAPWAARPLAARASVVRVSRTGSAARADKAATAEPTLLYATRTHPVFVEALADPERTPLLWRRIDGGTYRRELPAETEAALFSREAGAR